MHIQQTTDDPVVNLVTDTIRLQKQALVFVNSKRSAEASAEKIAKQAPTTHQQLETLAHNIETAASSPTKQCRRLAKIVRKGHAFHHAGLLGKQREIIEEAFKEGIITSISATPTLAIGVDTPAFRTIIRDTKRFSGGGMTDIPVLEYLQMSGRSGRPDFNDTYGEAILIAKNDKHAEQLTEKYIYGKPEAIYSKLASQPVLRTYTLSLIASEYITNTTELTEFFSETFFAHQYEDLHAITKKIEDIIEQLRAWGFLKQNTPGDDFISAADLTDTLHATPLGKRVSELYLDPLSAHTIIQGMYKASRRHATPQQWLHLLCTTNETRPLLRVKTSEYEHYSEQTQQPLLTKEPSMFDPEYETYLEALKTTELITEWINETSEEKILETYNVPPGELHNRKNILDWLLYASAEIARILKFHHHITDLNNLRIRLDYGVREELLALLKLKGIGRVRARKLYKNNIKTLQHIKETDATILARLIGAKNAQDIKKQVGQNVELPKISEKKRTGQLSLDNKKFH